MPRPAGLLALVLLTLTAGTLRADTLGTIRARGVLLWGGDSEGGGPYVFPDPADPAPLPASKPNWPTCWPASWE